MRKALIFYISQFSGHYHAANAIEKGLLEISRDVTVQKINAFSYTNPILEKLINKTYMQVIKKRPEVWGRIYDNPEFMKKTQRAREALHRFNMSKIKKLLDKRSPDVVYCTQAFPCGMVADYKKSSGKDIPLIGVLTDHAPHSYWIFDEVDVYVVPSVETGEKLEQKGVPSSKIRTYGIPVDPKFRLRHDVGIIREDLGFEKILPVILIMGGSQGLGVMETAVKALLKDTEHNYQLLVVTGSNKKLYSRLKRLAHKIKPDSAKILPYVDNVDKLMEAADLIITKAGGMTVAESLSKGLPLLIVDPIPGHERMNTIYLVEKGCALEVQDPVKIHEKVNEVFDSPDMLGSMKRNIERVSAPYSALDIARLAFEV